MGKLSDEMKKHVPSLMIAVGHNAPGEPPDDDGGDNAGVEAAAQDLIDAIGKGDKSGVAAALKNAFAILDAEPHSEGPHD